MKPRLTQPQIKILEVLERSAHGVSMLTYITRQSKEDMRERIAGLAAMGMVEDAHRGAYRLTEKGADWLAPEPVLSLPTPSRSYCNSAMEGSYSTPIWNHRPCSNSAVLSLGWA